LSAETFRRNDALHQLRLQTDGQDAETKSAEEVFRRYPTVRFDSALIDRETIVEIVLKSKLPITRIQRQLKQHPFFAKPEEMPSWRALLFSSEEPIEMHDAMVGRFEADFDRRTFHEEAEIYHVIGLSLWLSEIGFPSWEEALVVEKVRRYISDVYNGTADPDEMQTSTLVLEMGGAFGLAYTNMQDPRFSELANFHAQQRAAWQGRAYPAIAVSLRRLMTEDSEAFLRDICFTNGGAGRFARRGVLKHIPADEFAAAIANAHYRDQREQLVALAIRYQQVTAEFELQEEVPWLKEVQQHLHSLGKLLPPIARSNLFGLTRESLDKTVADVEERLRGKC